MRSTTDGKTSRIFELWRQGKKPRKEDPKRINFTNIQVNQEKEISKAPPAEKKEIRAAAVFAEAYAIPPDRAVAADHLANCPETPPEPVTGEDKLYASQIL